MSRANDNDPFMLARSSMTKHSCASGASCIPDNRHHEPLIDVAFGESFFTFRRLFVSEQSLQLSDASESTAAHQYLTFRLASEEYAIEILRVQEIKGDTPVARMPNTRDHVLGVTNLRGAIIPIVDLRRKFNLDCANDAASVVIIVLIGDKTVGVAVDAVTDVVDINPESVQPTPSLVTTPDAAVISGIAHVGERLIALLDFDSIIGADLDAAA